MEEKSDVNNLDKPIKGVGWMSNKLVWGIVAVVVIGILIVGYFMFIGGSEENYNEKIVSEEEISDYSGGVEECKYKRKTEYTQSLEEQLHYCHMEYAWRKKNPSICDNLAEDVDKCYEDYAIFNKDFSACEKIENDITRDKCFMRFAEDRSFCDEKIFNKPFVDACYLEVILDKNDLSACAELGESAGPCYIYFSEKNMDVSLCEKIDDVSYKEDCYINYAKVSVDISFCDFVSDDYKREHYCYTNIADLTWDLSVCEKIDDANRKDECYEWDKHDRVIPSYVHLYDSPDDYGIACSNDEYVAVRGGTGDYDSIVKLTRESRLLLYDRLASLGNEALLGISDLTCLEYLDLRRQGISDISYMEDLVNLRHLDLEADQGSMGNLLPTIEDISVLENMDKMEFLDLSLNNISDISVLGNLIEIKELDLGLNPVSSLSDTLDTLSNLKNLEILNFGSMTEGLELVRPSWCEEGDMCEWVPSESVDLAFFAEEFPKLKELIAGGTSFTNVEGISEAKNLRVLSLASGGYSFNYGELPSEMPNTLFMVSSENLPS